MSLKDFKPTTDMIHAAQAVFVCMAAVETLKPVVIGYKKAILAKYRFPIAKDKAEKRGKDEIILDPGLTYLLEDSDFQIYLEETFKARDKAGLMVDNPECCPLLVAEKNLIDAHHLLIDTMRCVTGIEFDQLFINFPENFNKYIDLTLRLLAPFVTNPFKTAEPGGSR